jgi:hypothetical protein
MPGNRENKGLKKEGMSLIYDTPSFFLSLFFYTYLIICPTLTFLSLR